MTKPEASTQYSAVRFGYAMNDRTVTHVIGETWMWDGAASCVPAIDYGRTFAWEFRYDGARQRYLTRALNPTTLQAYGTNGDTWTDYDGDSAYGDFSVDASPGTSVSNKRSFEPGLGRFEWSSTTTELNESYYHTDHLGTIRGVTDFIARWGEAMTFTAFGERIVGTQNSMSTRFGYVGSFGYQTLTADAGAGGGGPGAPGFLHVGARYYDPSTGRFLQRDPIGINSGTNVYSYVSSEPTVAVDPTGLWRSDPWFKPPKPDPPPFGPPPSPRDVQKGSQWIAAGCAVGLGFTTPIGVAIGAVIGVVVIVEDILEYVGVAPPAPDTWEEFTDWGGGGAG